MNETSPPNRCRIVLISPPGESADSFSAKFSAAISGGDVASIILPANGMDEAAFQAFAERIVPLAQEAGIAAIVADDSASPDASGPTASTSRAKRQRLPRRSKPFSRS